MTFPRWAMLVFGLALIGMGAEAAVMKGSMASLAGGGGSGALLLFATWFSLKNPRVGYILGLVVCMLMLGRFAPAFMQDQTKVYPALVTCALSLATIAVLLGGHIAAMRSKQS